MGGIITSDQAGRRLRVTWILFVLGISFEIAYFGGTPLLGILGIGPAIVYIDFGIHGFHGLVNSLFFASCVVTFARRLLGSSKGTLLLMLASFGYPIIVMSRQVLISLLLQYMFVYFSVRRPSARVFVRAGFFFIAAFLIFGYLGDIRSDRDNLIAVAAPSFDYPDWLPSAFIWFYIYICTPLNNVNFNINISPNYFPIETAGSLIPSFARDAFLNSMGGSQDWDLVSGNFNVSSLLQSLLTDFGVSGAIVFTLLCGLGFSGVLRRSATSPGAFFAVVILMHGVALSFFGNLLFQLVFISEIFIVAWIVARSHR
jgi:oligosaccharide repeat unit polymerase